MSEAYLANHALVPIRYRISRPVQPTKCTIWCKSLGQDEGIKPERLCRQYSPCTAPVHSPNTSTRSTRSPSAVAPSPRGQIWLQARYLLYQAQQLVSLVFPGERRSSAQFPSAQLLCRVQVDIQAVRSDRRHKPPRVLEDLGPLLPLLRRHY